MGMYTETQLKTAIHRRLHPFDFFCLAEGTSFHRLEEFIRIYLRYHPLQVVRLQARILNPKLIFKYLG